MLRRFPLLLLFAVTLVSSPAHAIFHEIKIVEVFGGGGAAGDGAQYVELQAFSSFQNSVGGHSVIFFNAAGISVGSALFTGPVDSDANQMTILIATSAAATLFNVTPDLLMTSPFIDRNGGKICWDTFDCFAWGAYMGPPGSLGTAVGTPFTALQPGVSAHRRLDISGSPTLLEALDDTGNSLNNFASGSPSPRNNDGLLGPEDNDGVLPALDNCPFLANSDQADADVDNRGNACECGDQNGDGRNTVTDLVDINLAIFNPVLVTPLCDGNGDGVCNVSDIIAANIEIFSPTSTSTCAFQPVPGP